MLKEELTAVLPEGKTGPTDHWPVVEDASACKMENCARQMVSRDIYYDEVCVCVFVTKNRQMVSHDHDHDDGELFKANGDP